MNITNKEIARKVRPRFTFKEAGKCGKWRSFIVSFDGRWVSAGQRSERECLALIKRDLVWKVRSVREAIQLTRKAGFKVTRRS